MSSQTIDFIAQYEEFIRAHPKGHFMQSTAWGKVKSEWKNEIIVVKNDSGQIKGAMSVLIRKIPFLPYTMMYSPRGPVCDPHDEQTLQELLDKSRQLAKQYRSYVVKMDPDIEKEDTQFEAIVWKLGFKVESGLDNYGGIQPRFVFRMDIKDKTEEEMLQSFHQKTRYNIRLSQKKGVVVKLGNREDLAVFQKLIVETGIRDNFIVRTRQYYERVYDLLGPDHIRLYVAYYEGQPIAASIPVVFGNKCWYVYGASSNEFRNLMPNYQLQWEMIKWGLESGSEIYDFRGVPGNLDENNPMIGLYKFKKGFNGKYTEFIGMIEYIYSPLIYFCVENGITVFRNLRRQLYIIKNKLTGKK
ncbi:MAG: lipid II:glycine glycyltransferase FemX [Acidobacteriota bacterium]